MRAAGKSSSVPALESVSSLSSSTRSDIIPLSNMKVQKEADLFRFLQYMMSKIHTVWQSINQSTFVKRHKSRANQRRVKC